MTLSLMQLTNCLYPDVYVKFINLRSVQLYTTISLIEMKMLNNSYITFSYDVFMVFLNTYDPLFPISIKTCYVCQLEAQHL